MKKTFLIFSLCLLGNISEAFFENPDIQSIGQQVSIEIHNEDRAKISLSETISNPTKSIQTFQYWIPFFQESSNIQFYKDSDGYAHKIYADKNEKISFLWEKASAKKIPGILGFFDSNSILASQEIRMLPNETQTIKVILETTIEKNDSWNALEILLNPKTPPQKTEIRFSNSSENIPHFIHNLPRGGLIHKTENTFSYLWKEIEKPLPKSLQFIWNTHENAEATYQNFTAKFFPLPLQKSFSNIFFLIDGSGSMYGNQWSIAEEITQFLLNNLPKTAFVNSGIFSTTLKKSQEFFALNTPETQKNILESMRNSDPVGKTDFENILTEIPENDLTIVITDDETLKIPEKIAQKNKWLILHFSSKSLPIYNFLRNGISIISLWKNQDFLLQKTEIQSALKNIRIPFIAEKKHQNTHTYQPKKRTYFDSETLSLSIEETPYSSGKNWKYFSILPKIWAQLRLAEILEEYEDLKKAPIEAFFSIVQTFGIETVFKTTDDFSEKSPADFSQEFFRLRNTIPSNHTKSNPPARTNQKTELDLFIQSFSEAHKELFQKIPEILALSTDGSEVCTKTRCISISPNHQKKTLTNLDKSFWNEAEAFHWGYEYLKEFVLKGIFSPDDSYQLFPDKAVTRAEFANAVYEYYSWKAPKKSQEKFSDIPEDFEYGTAIQFLRDQNIINGYEDNTFRPHQTITRAEAIKIILSIYGHSPDEKIPEIFVDTLGWESPWAKKAYKLGIIQGVEKNGDRYFLPFSPITRAEMAKIIIE